jgi:hypothetical protein
MKLLEKQKIDNSEHMYYVHTQVYKPDLKLEFPPKKFQYLVQPDTLSDKNQKNINPLVWHELANWYDILLTPEESLNGRFLCLLSELIATNDIVFKNKQKKEIRVQDIIFNVAILLSSKLDEKSSFPRFIISIVNCFDDNLRNVSIRKQDTYKRTKEYAKKLMIFLYEQLYQKLFEDKEKFDKIRPAAGDKPKFAHQITQWMWVRQGNIQDKNREEYTDPGTNYAFLKSDITSNKEDYKISSKDIMTYVEVPGSKLYQLNLLQRFEGWNELIKTQLKGWTPYRKDNIMYFHKPDKVHETTFENFKYVQYKNASLNSKFGDIVFEREFNQKDLSPKQKSNIFTILSNFYQIYLMPSLSNKEIILKLLIELIKNNPLVYKDKNNEDIFFTDIIFNISVNLDLDKYSKGPVFILFISNVANGDNVESMKEILEEQQLTITKEHAEQLLVFLNKHFKEKNCLAFSDIEPESGIQIKDLLFVSQASPWNIFKDKDSIFDKTKNFAYFNKSVTGIERNYVIDSAILFPMHPVVQELLNQHRQSISNPSNNQSFWSLIPTTLWSYIKGFFTFLLSVLWY